MSSNQKVTPSAPVQQQVPYAQRTYPVDNHLSTVRLGSDGFHVTTTPPSFVQQQPPPQQSNQGPSMRTSAPTGPPMQASTPPQTEIKVPQLAPQTNQLSMQFPQQSAVQRSPNTFYRPQPIPQTQRNNNHHRQPQMYPQHVQVFPNLAQSAMAVQISQLQMPYSQPPRQGYYQNFSYIPSQQIFSSYPTQQTQAPFYISAQNSTHVGFTNRGGPPQSVSTPCPQGTLPQNTPSLATHVQPPQMIRSTDNKRKSRKHAIPVIHPITGKNVLGGSDTDESPLPESGESSARETPQPGSAGVSAAFTMLVAQRANETDVIATEPATDRSIDIVEDESNLPSKLSKRIEPISASESKLQACTKEFIPEKINPGLPSKEVTPVVSANSDGAEVTISSNKSGKEKESPAKGRKQRENTATQRADASREMNRDTVVSQHRSQSRERENVQPITSLPSKQDLIHRETRLPSETKESSPLQENVSVQLSDEFHGSIPLQRESIPQVQHLQTSKEVLQMPEHVSVQLKEPSQLVQPEIAPVPHENVSKNKVTGGKGKSDHKQSSSAHNNVAVSMNADNPQQGKQKANATISKSNKESSNKQSAAIPAPATVNTKQTQQSTAPISVPPSQPAKQSNRSNKMRELNRKGADKEGTDMDAFETNDSIPQPNSIDNAPIEQSLPDVPVEKKQHVKTNDIVNNKTEVKSLPKMTVDVTSIVKNVEVGPRTLPSKPTQIVPTPVQKEDIDKNMSDQDKFVQVKNEVNANSNENEDVSTVIDPKPSLKLSYKEGRWSPSNPDGKKIYDRDFLYDLKNDPKSRKRPENLPTDLLIPLKDLNSRNRLADNRQFSNMNRPQHEILMPCFVKSQSQRSSVTKRGSQQGNKAKSGKPVIHMSLSLREDVKLHEAENAWRPARLKDPTCVSNEDEFKTQELYKKVRGVLNKLTPQKFDTLVGQVRSLNIDNSERLQGVIDLVFEKAVDEPNFSKAYALMCRELALMQVPQKKHSEEDIEYVNFRKLLITRCQMEFEKNYFVESARNLKVKEIDVEPDPEKKKEMQLMLEDEDRRVRIKSVGNVRFIGELFKQQMLTVSIMLRCMRNLLDTIEEESLECLCKLLTTIGKDLEIEKKQNLVPFFNKMQEIVDKKHGKISSRVRFMLQDVIELRANRWVPRRQDLKPTTMDQIQKEADTEQMNIHLMNSGSMNTARKDDRSGLPGGPSGSDRKRRGNVTDDGWSPAPSRGGRTPYSVETQKLKSNKPASMDNLQLGSSQLFGNWGRGSNIKSQQSPFPPLGGSTNMYAALEHVNAENDRARPATIASRNGNRDPYSSKGTSMERYKTSYDDERGSRSGSLARSRDGSQARQVSTQQTTAATPSTTAAAEFSPEQMINRVDNILEEYLNDLISNKDCETEIRNTFPQSTMPLFVTEVCNKVVDLSEGARSRAGCLLAYLVKSDVMSQQDCATGLAEMLAVADDLTIDIPMIWDYLAEMIVPLIIDDVIQLATLYTSCFPILIEQKHAGKLLAALFKRLSTEKDQAHVRDTWVKSQLKLSDFMNTDDISKFIKCNALEYLEGSNVSLNTSSSIQGTLGFEQIRSKLLQLFITDASHDDVMDWIDTNIGEKQVQEKEFIRALMTAVCEHSIVHSNTGALRLKPEILKSHYKLLHYYVDSTESRELQCIYALQALVHKLEHPQGMLLEIFDKLWEDSILSSESFLTWEACTNPAEQEGKGVALKMLTSFFTAVKETDNSSASEAE